MICALLCTHIDILFILTLLGRLYYFNIVSVHIMTFDGGANINNFISANACLGSNSNTLSRHATRNNYKTNGILI